MSRVVFIDELAECLHATQGSPHLRRYDGDSRRLYVQVICTTTPHFHVNKLSTTILLQPFNGLFSRTTWVSRYKKGKTNLDITGARDSEWQWHQLSHMQVSTSLQTDNHTSTPPLSFLQAGCPSCRPTNSVKALKAQVDKLSRGQKIHFTLDENIKQRQCIWKLSCALCYSHMKIYCKVTHTLSIHDTSKTIQITIIVHTLNKKVKVAHTRLPSVGFRS